MKYVTALLLLLAAAGCGVETDDRPVSFTYIHRAILVPACATAACHSSQNDRANVDMEDHDLAYEQWSGISSKELSGMYGMIGGEVAPDTVLPEAGRMPLDSPLPDADILLIGRWIDDGSQDN